MALLILAGLASLVAVGVTQSMTEVASARMYAANQQAFQVAEAGIDRAAVYLRSLPSPPDAKKSFDPFNGVQTIGNGTYAVLINPSASNDNSFSDDYNIAVTGEANGVQIRRNVICILRTESFARFAYFADKNVVRTANAKNDENDEQADDGVQPVWWTNNTYFAGPVHINGEIYVDGSPTFEGKVSSGKKDLAYANGGPPADDPQFLGGLDLKVPKISLPGNLNLLSANSLTFKGDTSVEINNTSLFVTNDGITKTYGLDKPIFVQKGDLEFLGGTLKGKLTLGSEKNIVIKGSTSYACDPESGYDPDCENPGKPGDSKDLLGLVAQKDVILDVPAPGDVTLQAVIMAMKGAFKVADYNAEPAKGTLHIYGGIIQKRAGYTGITDPNTGQLLSGYQGDYVYDRRMLSTAPPFYPTTGRYIEMGWFDAVPPVYTLEGAGGGGLSAEGQGIGFGEGGGSGGGPVVE